MTARRLARFAQEGWYPASPGPLAELLGRVCPPFEDPGDAWLIISPHAGYAYSGAVAGQAYRRVRIPDLVVVLGVGHHPAARPNVVGLEGAWETPLGDVRIDGAAAAAILEASDLVEADHGELAGEHSLEMQLPFLKWRNPDVRIVPIQVRELTGPQCRRLGEAIASALAGRAAGSVALVASTDLHHQHAAPGVHPPTRVPELDAVAIDRIAAFDPDGLYRDVRAAGVQMCGLLPTTTALHAARALGATAVETVAHATSYDVSGSARYVVGYLSAIAPR